MPETDPTEAAMLAVPTVTSKLLATSTMSIWKVTPISQVERADKPNTGKSSLLCDCPVFDWLLSMPFSIVEGNI
jgi:hypothetical protein